MYYCPDLLNKNPEFVDISILAGNKNISLCSWFQVESIVADQEEENTFYMIYKDVMTASNSGVYKFIHYPDSTHSKLIPITYNLKRIGFNKLKIDKHTNTLYMAANDGVYCLDVSHEDTVWKTLSFFPKVLASDIAFNYYTNTIYVATFGRGIWGSQIPSFNNTNKTIKKNRKVEEPFKIDGVLTLKAGKTLQLNSKLIITPSSKIELKRNSKLIVGEKCKVVGEDNKSIDLKEYVFKHKSAQVIKLNTK